MRSFRGRCRCWLASMPHRPTAILAVAEHRDADTWGVHLLDATRQGLQPDYTIADAGQGLRAGQKAAWDNTPCHGDVFHIQRQCEGLANTLSRLAKGAPRGLRNSRPGSTALASKVRTASLPSSWKLRGRPRPGPVVCHATSDCSPSG